MSEADFWNTIRDGMGGSWHAQRHEDKYSTGIADVSFGMGRLSDGWIELKYKPAHPIDVKRAWDFTRDHFTPEQRNWLTQRAKHGTGRVFLAAQLGTVYYLWSWPKLEPLLGMKNFDVISKAAIGVWSPRIDFTEFRQALLNGRRQEPMIHAPREVRVR